MKRSDLNPIVECYKQALYGVGELAIPAAGFMLCVVCLIFMPVIWGLAWVATCFDKEVDDV